MVTGIRDARRSTPRMANYMLNVLKAMPSLALQKKRIFGISENVAANVTRFGIKASVKPRRLNWTCEDEKRFLDDADQTDPVMTLGQQLLAFTGQRPGDTRAMMLTDYDGEKIRVVETYFVRTYEMGATAITKLEVHQDRLKDERN
jgi:hypothetical protein